MNAENTVHKEEGKHDMPHQVHFRALDGLLSEEVVHQERNAPRRNHVRHFTRPHGLRLLDDGRAILDDKVQVWEALREFEAHATCKVKV